MWDAQAAGKRTDVSQPGTGGDLVPGPLRKGEQGLSLAECQVLNRIPGSKQSFGHGHPPGPELKGGWLAELSGNKAACLGGARWYPSFYTKLNRI